MIIDITLILVFIVSLWIGWSLRIYIDAIHLLWIFLFTGFIFVLLPYFAAFVYQSSAHIPRYAYYFFGLTMSLLIFLCFFMLIKVKKSSSGLRRFAGGLTLALLSVYSLIIVLWTLAGYGWISITDSSIFEMLPEWFFFDKLSQI